MNLFFLQKLLEDSAKENVDSHVNKIIMEAVELLYSVWHITEDNSEWKLKTPNGKAYGRLYQHHTLTIWASQCKGNYLKIADFCIALCNEFLVRSKKNTDHACRVHGEWCKVNIPPKLIDTSEVATQPPQAIGSVTGSTKDFRHLQICNGTGEDFHTICAYRQYYLAAKGRLMKYTNRTAPNWFNKEDCEYWSKIPSKNEPTKQRFHKDNLYKVLMKRKFEENQE